jgi:hypothetical protein
VHQVEDLMVLGIEEQRHWLEDRRLGGFVDRLAEVKLLWAVQDQVDHEDLLDKEDTAHHQGWLLG